MNLKQLEAFIWVAELKSFTRAAKQLYMSQPAISFQVKALEDDLKVPLFHRAGKKIILTDAGHLLYLEAKQMLKHYHKIKIKLDELKGLKSGNLTIGASTIPGEYILPLLIGRFKELYPGIQISLKVGGSGEVGKWMQEREIDFGITGAPLKGDGIEIIPWIKDQLVLIVPPEHRWVKRKSITLDELSQESLIIRGISSGTRYAFEQKLVQHGLSLEQLQIIMELGSTRAVITAVQGGLGISVVSKWAVREVLQLSLVKEVTIADINLDRNLFLVYYEQENGSSFASEAFMKFIKDKKVLKSVLGTY